MLVFSSDDLMSAWNGNIKNWFLETKFVKEILESYPGRQNRSS
jgi:hypothetical protein